MDEEKHVLMNAGMLRRVIELPFNDLPRKALLEFLYIEFATHLLAGLPVQGVLFKPAKWKGANIIIIGAKTVDLYANNIFNAKYATGGGMSRNHRTSLGFVEGAMHIADVPYKPTASTNGPGTNNAF